MLFAWGAELSVVGLELGSVWRVSEERRDLEHSARRKPAGVFFDCEERTWVKAWRDACSFLRTTRRNAAWSGENPALFRGERNGAGCEGVP
ncbi:MAG: hypothetical protein ACI9SQ_001594, partial [Rubritalea sp.]